MTAPDQGPRRGAFVALAVLLVLALAGCASFSPDSGFGPVAATVKDRAGHDVAWARSDGEQQRLDERVQALLGRPLQADDAVQLALLNNRGLQARFEGLALAEAERVQAGRLANPGFSFGRSVRGDEREIERSLHLNLARLIALPLIGDLEARRVVQMQNEVALEALTLAADTRKAWVNAVAAVESVRYARQVLQAAQASAELARRMEQVGNFNKLQRARQEVFQAEAAMGLARAEQRERAMRERLTRLLGVWGEQTRYTLPERLPELPAAPRDLPDIERTAMASRLDVQGARQAAEQTARNLGLTRSTRFVNVLELGLSRNGSNEAPTQRGWEVSVELPLFDSGAARVARAEAVYRQALHRAAEAAVNARSEVREAYGAYRSAFDLARFQRDEVLPLAQQISEENLLRYNGMLIGVFELLADTRAQIATVHGAIQALRDFWLAQADLNHALIGRPALAEALGAAAPASEPAAGGH